MKKTIHKFALFAFLVAIPSWIKPISEASAHLLAITGGVAVGTATYRVTEDNSKELVSLASLASIGVGLFTTYLLDAFLYEETPSGKAETIKSILLNAEYDPLLASSRASADELVSLASILFPESKVPLIHATRHLIFLGKQLNHARQLLLSCIGNEELTSKYKNLITHLEATTTKSNNYIGMIMNSPAYNTQLKIQAEQDEGERNREHEIYLINQDRDSLFWLIIKYSMIASLVVGCTGIATYLIIKKYKPELIKEAEGTWKTFKKKYPNIEYYSDAGYKHLMALKEASTDILNQLKINEQTKTT